MTVTNIILLAEQTEGTKAVVSQWLYDEGDFVEKDQPIVELETDKVMMEVVAPSSGILVKKQLDTGDEVKDSQPLGQIDSSKSISKKQPPTTNTNKHSTETKSTTSRSDNIDNTDSANQFISPAVRRLLSTHQINIKEVVGTGKNQRITSRDIQNHLNHLEKPVDTSSKHISLSNMRKSIAKHMVRSLLHTAPHVTSVFNLDLSAVIAHRNLYKQDFNNQSVKLTFTAYFIAASVAAIKQVPIINSQLHQDSIEVFNQINIGIGTALEDKGLIVPVLKNCQDKDLFAIAKNLSVLTDKARNKRLQPADVQDGTFTISNHGVSGSLVATPIIINQPQSAILGIGKMEKRVIVKELDGQDIMTIKPMCYVSLTIDHRVLDAHQCNQFLNVFVETLESWK